MSRPAIMVDGLSKRYRIGQREPYKVLRESLTDAVAAPWRRLRAAWHGAGLARRDEANMIWALHDVSFSVEQGEVVGVIGRNGAGKTTLLKLLSRITEPTEGTAKIEGRVASLLEVGTGFHPELTGRENIYLNGAILGMRRAEIERKLDAIIAFAEIEQFSDTPVKRYSSGMYVRLAFAVAAHLEPDILIVDEVLAVGDTAFQQKCLGKMDEVSRSGRTVLFVSHNMAAVGRLCGRALLLDCGRLAGLGRTHDVIAQYLQGVGSFQAELSFAPDLEKTMQLLAVRLRDQEGRVATRLDRARPFTIEIDYAVRRRMVGAHVTFTLERVDGIGICASTDVDAAPEGILDRSPGLYCASVEFPGGLLNAGTYRLRFGVARYGGPVYDHQGGCTFELQDTGTFVSHERGGQLGGVVLAIGLPWTTRVVAPLESAGAEPVGSVVRG